MVVNEKKPLKLKNRTVYFDPGKDRTHVQFSSPYTYSSRRQKIEGYETRLFWQYKYCEDHSGQTYFYTLTYNDRALPHYGDQPCFDYEDLRDLLTGGFRKKLLRRYGTTFKYFIGAELGDGKGTRGMHNNPHYHVLFFLENAHNPRYPYKVIGPRAFRNLVRMYWQGFDEAIDGPRDYNQAKYGIAREGENIGLVTDYRACMYCAKYVCKDAKLKSYEDDIVRASHLRHKRTYRKSMQSYKDFFPEVNKIYNIPLNAKNTEWTYTPEQLIEHLLPDFWETEHELDLPIDLDFDLGTAVLSIIHRYNLWQDYSKFCRDRVDEMVKKDLLEYRNRYCNKCRISQGVGSYALEKIDPMNPGIQVPSKKGFKTRPLSLYYYRKLYYDVVKDKRGSTLYVLNPVGQAYKLSKLPEQLSKKARKASSNIDLLVNNPELFEKMRESDVNTEVFYHHDDFLRRMDYLLEENNIENILERYAAYKTIYEDRCFPYKDNGDTSGSDFPVIDYLGDYQRFIVPSYYTVRRNDLRLDAFLENGGKGYMPYREHPYFLRYLGIFGVLDTVADYLSIQKDGRDQKEAEERAATKRFHDQRKLKEFYAFFK